MTAQSGRDSIVHAAKLARDAIELLDQASAPSDIAAHLDLAAARLEVLANKQSWIAKPSCSRRAPTPGDSLELSDRNAFNLAVREDGQQPDVHVGTI